MVAVEPHSLFLHPIERLATPMALGSPFPSPQLVSFVFDGSHTCKQLLAELQRQWAGR